jgi:hypothetical protein
MAITKLKQHNKCPVSINLCKAKEDGYARLVCEKHKVEIQLLSKADVIAIKGKLL